MCFFVYTWSQYVSMNSIYKGFPESIQPCKMKDMRAAIRQKRPQLWTTGDWRLHHNNVPAYVSRLVYSFLWKHLITLATQPPLQPRFGALRLLAFSKTKITFEWDWGVIILCTMFLVSCIFFNKCLYFSYYMAGYFSDSPRIEIYIYR